MGIHFIDFLPGAPDRLGPTLASLLRPPRDAGATMFRLADHFFQMETVGRAQNPFLEAYTSMGFLAGQTTSIDLTMLVTSVTYRFPGVLAKTLTTLDVQSQGRSMCGLGTAWYERERIALGIPYPPVAHRFEMMKETRRSACRCGATTPARTRARIIGWPRRSMSLQPIRRSPILIGGDDAD